MVESYQMSPPLITGPTDAIFKISVRVRSRYRRLRVGLWEWTCDVNKDKHPHWHVLPNDTALPLLSGMIVCIRWLFLSEREYQECFQHLSIQSETGHAGMDWGHVTSAYGSIGVQART